MGRQSRTRGSAVRSAVDVSALSSAVQRPGIDPRAWIRLAIVTKLGFDAAQGIFADIRFQPDGGNDTALVGTNYAGNGFGDWNGLEIDDTVLVAVPNGDTGSGPVIICRMWNGGDPPPEDFGDDSSPPKPVKDRIIRVKPGQKFKIQTSDNGDGVNITVAGDGDVVLQTTGNGKVKAGGTDGLEEAALGRTLQTFLDQLNQFEILVSTHVHPVTSAPGTTGPAVALAAGPPSVPNIKATKVEIK